MPLHIPDEENLVQTTCCHGNTGDIVWVIPGEVYKLKLKSVIKHVSWCSPFCSESDTSASPCRGYFANANMLFVFYF